MKLSIGTRRFPTWGLAVPVVMVVAAAVAIMTASGITELGENELAAAFLFFGMGLATALIWLADYIDIAGKLWPTLARLLGYGSLIGAVTVGTWQTWTGISDILAGDFF